MADKTYTELLAQIRALCGVSSFTSDEQTRILANANKRLYQAYCACEYWPRYWVGAQARPATSGVIATTYDDVAGIRNVSSASRSGTTVTVVCTAAISFYTGMYVTISGLTGSVDPNGLYQVSGVDTTTVTNDTFTFTLATGTGTETYTGSGVVTPSEVSEINRFIRVYGGNPNATDSVAEYEFYEQSDGAHVVGVATSIANTLSGYYVQYIKQWDGPYTTDSTTIPREFFYFAAHACYADFLRSDGQTDKAIAEESNANVYLEIELAKAAPVANSRRYSRVSTHLSRQARL